MTSQSVQSTPSALTPTTADTMSTAHNASAAHNSNVTGTALPSIGENGSPGVPGLVIGLMLGVVTLGVAIFGLLFYLKKTGKLYTIVPFKRLSRQRVSSISSSRGPLGVDEDDHPHGPGGRGGGGGEGDGEEDDSLPPTREGNMFTIDDFETEPVDLDSQSRGTNDEYFYDEVFGKSVFEDEVTNASMRHLYLADAQEDDQELFDVDAIVSSITGTKSKTTKT